MSAAPLSRRIGSASRDPGTVRVETGAVTEHCASDVQQAISNRAEGATVTVAASAQRPVLAVADRIELHGDARPMEDSVPESAVRRQATLHEQAPTRALRDRSHPAPAAKRGVVAPPHRVAARGKQRGQHPGADAGQRPQDRRVRRLGRRLWVVLRGCVGAIHRSSLGELLHQSVELLVRVMKLAVEQGEASTSNRTCVVAASTVPGASLTAGSRSRSRSVVASIRLMRCCFNTLVKVTPRARWPARGVGR